MSLLLHVRVAAYQVNQKCGFANFCKSLQLCILSVLVGTKALVEYVYVSKSACNCHVWEF